MSAARPAPYGPGPYARRHFRGSGRLMRAGDRPLRLLPWPGPEGKPCFLSSDGSGMLTRLADDMEHTQLAMGEELLGHAREMLDDHTVTAHQLHYLAARLCEALRDALRVAESRGERLCAAERPADGDA